MTVTEQDLLLYTFRDAGRTAAVLDAVRCPGWLQSVAVVGHSDDGEIRVVDDGAPGASRRLLTLLLDVLSGPLAGLGGTPGGLAGPPVVLPLGELGVATFTRLVRPGGLVLLAALCDGTPRTGDEIAARLMAAHASSGWHHRVPGRVVARARRTDPARAALLRAELVRPCAADVHPGGTDPIPIGR